MASGTASGLGIVHEAPRGAGAEAEVDGRRFAAGLRGAGRGRWDGDWAQSGRIGCGNRKELGQWFEELLHAIPSLDGEECLKVDTGKCSAVIKGWVPNSHRFRCIWQTQT